ncbi:MAG: hypothetical protein KI786_00295, partial [Mameliella sp.]|nr:hypothetical protein [Phaeodactylibacter sp.]
MSIIRFLQLVIISTGLTVALWQCSTVPTIEAVQFDPSAVPYNQLSDYRFFKTLNSEGATPNTGVLPYEPITPLFTDYAHKARYVWMPDSVEATVAEDGQIIFPDNTVLIKTFYYPADFSHPDQSRDLVETRLMMKTNGTWDAYTYIWNERGTEAELNLVGDFKSVSWTDEQGHAQTVEYAIPNKNQCKSCHNQENILMPIGPKVRNLNKAYAYADGRLVNQVEQWQAAGKLAKGDW